MEANWKLEDNYKIEDDKFILTVPKPEQYDPELLKKYDMKIETSEYIWWAIQKKHIDNLNSISKQKRQEIYACFHKGGITIGETAEKFGVPSDVVADIIYINMQKLYLPREESL